ncbi:nucleoside-diphosphate sugar epimerase/dehydratase [Aeromonas hydrophila]
MQSEFTYKISYEFERNLPDDFYYRFGDYNILDIAIFGTGTGALKFYDKIEAERNSSGKCFRVKCYFDNNESKHGEIFLGKEVKMFSLDGASDIDVIFVASDYWPEINCQLTSLGVEPAKIIRVY